MYDNENYISNKEYECKNKTAEELAEEAIKLIDDIIFRYNNTKENK